MTDAIDTRKEKLSYTARTHGGREGESRSLPLVGVHLWGQPVD